MPRNRTSRRRGAAALAAGALVLLTGCGGDDDPGGDAPSATGEPAPSTPSSDPSAPEPAPTGTEGTDGSGGSGGDPGLAALDPCAMVDAAGVTSLGLTGGEAETLGEARICRYRFEGPTLNESFTVSIELFGTYGTADIVATDIQPLPPVGTHDAVTFTGVAGGCAVSLGVTETSRMDATAVGGDPALACDHAAALAALGEPALP